MAVKEKSIRVLICNQYALFRDGLKALLPPGTPIEIVGEAASAKEAFSLLARVKPDVVLMDAMVADTSGSEATRRIKAVYPNVKVIVVSLHDDESLISTCLSAGAAGSICRHDQSANLKQAIYDACGRAHAA